jgi:hypothetical protein
MHVWQLNAQGLQLVGHPGAWVVHRPHSPSAGYLKAFTGPRYTAQHQVHMRSIPELLMCLAATQLILMSQLWWQHNPLIGQPRLQLQVHGCVAGHRAHEAHGAHGKGDGGGGAERDLPSRRRVSAGRLQSSPAAAGACGKVVVKAS